MKSKPTLREVARRAECSMTTTSNILQGRHNLYRTETVARVLTAARELGYRANHLARSLAKQRTFTIGLVLDRHHAVLTRNDYAQHVLDGIIAYLEPRDYDVKLIMPHSDSPDYLWRRIENGTIDGALLLAPVIGSPLLDWHAHSRLPVVAAGSTMPASYGISTVDIDNEGAMRSMVNWIVQQGHRAIGFVKGHPLHWSAQQRERAFRSALSEQGVPVHEEWIVQGDYSLASGKQAVEQLLKRSLLPTAVVCANDGMAAGFIQACTERGIRIPEDLSIAGFDDEPLIHPIAPHLTTVRHDKYEVGHLAARLLLEQIDKEDVSHRQILLPGAIVVRQTVLSPKVLVQTNQTNFALPNLSEGGSQ